MSQPFSCFTVKVRKCKETLFVRAFVCFCSFHHHNHVSVGALFSRAGLKCKRFQSRISIHASRISTSLLHVNSELTLPASAALTCMSLKIRE